MHGPVPPAGMHWTLTYPHHLITYTEITSPHHGGMGGEDHCGLVRAVGWCGYLGVSRCMGGCGHALEATLNTLITKTITSTVVVWAVRILTGGDHRCGCVGGGEGVGGGGAGNALPAAPTTHTTLLPPTEITPPTVVVMGGDHPHRR